MGIIQKILELFKKYRNQTLIVIMAIVVALLYGNYMGYFTKEEFRVSRLNREMVFFSMKGCSHCEDMKPAWDLLVNNNGNNDYIELNQVVAQDKPELIEKYGIQSFPTILALKDGEINMTYSGDRSYESLLQFLNNAMTN